MNLRSIAGALKGLPLSLKLTAVVTVALAGYVGALKVQNARLTRTLQEESLRANNEAARADSTHLVVLAQNDTIKAWQKLAVQEKQASDELDRKLKRETRLRVALQLRVDSFVVVVGGSPTVEDVIGRHGVFDTYQAPFTVHAEVLLPAPPEPGTMRLRMQLDPIRINVRAQCGEPNVFGSRTAHILVEAPAWTGMELGTLTQSSEVCMPQFAAPVVKSKFKLGVGVGVAFVLLSHFFLGAP